MTLHVFREQCKLQWWSRIWTSISIIWLVALSIDRYGPDQRAQRWLENKFVSLDLVSAWQTPWTTFPVVHCHSWGCFAKIYTTVNSWSNIGNVSENEMKVCWFIFAVHEIQNFSIVKKYQEIIKVKVWRVKLLMFSHSSIIGANVLHSLSASLNPTIMCCWTVIPSFFILVVVLSLNWTSLFKN